MLFIPYESIGAGGESLISIVPILGIGWTLNLEVYFYLFFACANKLSHKNRGLITSLIIFGIFLLGIFFPSSNLVFKFLTSPVILEFVVGIIIYYIYKHLICNKKSSNSESLLCMFISIIYFLIMIFLNIKYDSQYRILTFGIPSFIIVFSFLVAYNNKEIPKNFLLLGKISYSFYFIEFFTSAIINIVITKLAANFIINILLVIVTIIITFIISYISWYLLEDKLTRKIKQKLDKC